MAISSCVGADFDIGFDAGTVAGVIAAGLVSAGLASAVLLDVAFTAFGAETLSPFTVFRPVVFMNRSYKAVDRAAQKKNIVDTARARAFDLPVTWSRRFRHNWAGGGRLSYVAAASSAARRSSSSCNSSTM